MFVKRGGINGFFFRFFYRFKIGFGSSRKSRDTLKSLTVTPWFCRGISSRETVHGAVLFRRQTNFSISRQRVKENNPMFTVFEWKVVEFPGKHAVRLATRANKAPGTRRNTRRKTTYVFGRYAIRVGGRSSHKTTAFPRTRSAVAVIVRHDGCVRVRGSRPTTARRVLDRRSTNRFLRIERVSIDRSASSSIGRRRLSDSLSARAPMTVARKGREDEPCPRHTRVPCTGAREWKIYFLRRRNNDLKSLSWRAEKKNTNVKKTPRKSDRFNYI